MMKLAVPVRLGCLEAPLFTLQNSFTKLSCDFGCVFDELLDRYVVLLSYDTEARGHLEPDTAVHLVFNELEDFLLHTYEAAFVFRPFVRRAKNARLAVISVVLSVLTMNFLSKITSGGTSGSSRS